MTETFVSGPGLPEQMPLERGTWLLRACWESDSWDEWEIHEWEIPWKISASTETTSLMEHERDIFANACGVEVDESLDYYLAFRPAPAR